MTGIPKTPATENTINTMARICSVYLVTPKRFLVNHSRLDVEHFLRCLCRRRLSELNSVCGRDR